VARLFFGRQLLGLTSYLYTPGLPMDEFLLAHYHYFTLPVCFLALYFMGKKKSNALKLVGMVTPVVLLVSYFAFPQARNVNCVYGSCMTPFAHWTGMTYSILFGLCALAAHLGATYYFEQAFSGMKRTVKRNRTFVHAFTAVACLALFVSCWDLRYKSTLPHLACAPDSETGMSKIGCEYTREHLPGTMIFGYHLKNKTNTALVCQTRAKTQYNEFVLNDRVKLAPGENRRMGQVLPNPDVSVNVELTAICEQTSDRAVASE
jgi:hypothetical protein